MIADTPSGHFSYTWSGKHKGVRCWEPDFLRKTGLSEHLLGRKRCSFFFGGMERWGPFFTGTWSDPPALQWE